jgi:putative chitinase
MEAVAPVTPDQLRAFCPAAQPFLDGLLATFARYEISTPVRQAAFLAQVAHESGGFSRVVENLNYSAQRLLQIFPRRFTDLEQAARYERQPAMIANHVYAGRLGNGGEASGDGWHFRGRGLIQVTGRDNYRACSIALFGDERLLATPELLEQPHFACESAGWFWQSRQLNQLADQDRFDDITRKINGGQHGCHDRHEWLRRATAALAVAPRAAA